MIGVKVVVIVGMEEDMEEKLVEELVVKWVEMEAGQGGSTAMLGCWSFSVGLEMKKEERKK